MKEVQENLIALINSCVEGYNGDWDVSTEGLNGFMDMYELLQNIANDLNIDVSKAKNINVSGKSCEYCKNLENPNCGNDTTNHSCFE